jgi:hypothetical protein
MLGKIITFPLAYFTGIHLVEKSCSFIKPKYSLQYTENQFKTDDVVLGQVAVWTDR